jgi:hypothetical protein
MHPASPTTSPLINNAFDIPFVLAADIASGIAYNITVITFDINDIAFDIAENASDIADIDYDIDYDISDNGAISTFTFSGDRHDSKPVTMESSMVEAYFGGKHLGASGAIMAAAFLPKCT